MLKINPKVNLPKLRLRLCDKKSSVRPTTPDEEDLPAMYNGIKMLWKQFNQVKMLIKQQWV
jgi:hypothetical protein